MATAPYLWNAADFNIPDMTVLPHNFMCSPASQGCMILHLLLTCANAVPSQSLTGYQLTVIDAHRVKLVWQPPPLLSRNGMITRYKYVLQRTRAFFNASWSPSLTAEVEVDSDAQESSVEVVLNSLWANSSYSVLVMACTAVGCAQGQARYSSQLATPETGW